MLWRPTGHVRLRRAASSWPQGGALPLAGLGAHHVLHLPGRDGQVGPVPAPRLAARRDGGPDAGLGADPRRDDGDGGRVPAGPRPYSLFALTPDVLAVVAWIGAFTALLAATLACVQDDIKRVLAYSTVSQLGYMMAAIGAGVAARGLPAPAHARRLQGAALPRRRRGDPRRRHQRHLPTWAASRGACRRRRSSFLVGTLSLAGIPLFAGFFSKEEILGAVCGGRAHGAVRDAAARRVPHGVLHVPRRLPRVLRRAARPRRRPRRTSRAAGADARRPLLACLGARCRSLARRSAMALGMAFADSARRRRRESAGAGLAARRSRVGVALAGIAARVARSTSAARSIAREPLARRSAPIRGRRARRFWLDDVFAGLYRGVAPRLLAPRRLDRSLPRRRRAERAERAGRCGRATACAGIQTGQAQDYVYGVAVGRAPARLVLVAAVARDRPARPLDHHVGAVRRRRAHHVRSARHRPLLVRLIARRGDGRSRSCCRSGIYVAYDREAAGFQFHEELPAGAAARHLATSSASTA